MPITESWSTMAHQHLVIGFENPHSTVDVNNIELCSVTGDLICSFPAKQGMGGKKKIDPQ